MIAPNTNKSIAEAIEESQDKYLSEKIFRSRWKSLRASGIDDVCNRRLFYYMTCGELADTMDTQLVAVFEEGKEQEPGVRRFLSELGFEIQRAQANESWDQFRITGQIDGVLPYNGEKYLAEIKTVSDFAWDKLHTIEDFDDGYYKKWKGQMQIYLLLFGFEKGVFILKRKQAKQVRVIEVVINYEYAETLLKKAEIVNKSVDTNTPPDFIQNPVECRKCPFFGKVCNPPMNFGEMAQIEDPKLADKLARREELAASRKEYEALDKEIKERFKEIPDAICGDFHIRGKAGVMKIKAKEAHEISTWKTTIERIGARVEV